MFTHTLNYTIKIVIFPQFVDYRPLFYRLHGLKFEFMLKIEKQELLNLGNKLRDLRQNKALSQERFAELTGLDRTYISGLERGKRNPSFLIIQRLCKVLEINPNELFISDK